MINKLIFGLFIAVLMSSCDKLQSISTNKNTQQKSADSLKTKDLNFYDDTNPEVSVSSLSKLVKKNKGKYEIYMDKNSPKFSTKDCFFPYIRIEGDGAKLYLKVQHVDVEELNINSYIVTADKVDYTIEGEVSKTKLNGKKQYYVETLDKLISTEEDVEALVAIANGEYVKTILVGENRFVKKDISEKMKKAFHNVLVAYIYLKKK